MTKPKLTHEKMKKMALKRPGVKKEYKALKDEFDLIEEMIKARTKAGKTQEQVAKKMKTSTSVIGRLESSGKHSPSIDTLRRYAKALGCELKIKFVQHHNQT